MDKNFIDRIRGVAVGAAVGDALGMPLEFKPQQQENHLVTEMLPDRLPAGTFTDDTEMALALAESILDQRSLDPVDLGKRFVAWMGGNPPDIGIHTRTVLNLIASGHTWERAVAEVQRQNPSSAGNGSVMRCWPVSLVWWHDIKTLIRDSILQSQVTHPHAECVYGSAFVNVTIAYLLHGIAPKDAIHQAIQKVKLPHELRKVIDQAPDKERCDLQNTGWVRHTLESVVWGFLTTGSFEDALIRVVNLGSDADTAGAVVGALAGAAYGINAIPARWRNKICGEYPLNSGKIWHEDALVALADRLAESGKV